MEELGRRIRSAVDRSGRNREQIAREAGVTPSTLYKVMGGKSEPGSLTLAGIARAVGTSPDALLGFVPGAAIEEPRPSARLLLLATELGELKAADRRALAVIAQSLRRAGKAKESNTSAQAGSPSKGRTTTVRPAGAPGKG